jgi:hypothetical protein
MPCPPWRRSGVVSLDLEETGYHLLIEELDGWTNGVIVKVWGWVHLQDGHHLGCCKPTGKNHHLTWYQEM